MVIGAANLTPLDELFIEYSHRLACPPATAGCGAATKTEVISWADPRRTTHNSSKTDKIDLIFKNFSIIRQTLPFKPPQSNPLPPL
jgi:hypothetical protein